MPSNIDKQHGLGPLLIAGGSGVIFICTLLPWVSAPGASFSLWKSDVANGHRLPIVLVLLLVVIGILVGMYFAQGQARLLPMIGALGLFEAGYVFAIAVNFALFSQGGVGSGGAGSYIGGLSALVVGAGAWLTLAIDSSALAGLGAAVRSAAAGPRAGAAGTSTPTPAAGGTSTAGGATHGQTAGAQAPNPSGETEDINQGAAAGWYPDPSGEHRERLWDGSAWTEQVR